MATQRLMFNICSDDLEKSRAFYVRLFDLKVNFESDWFIQLQDKSQPFEIGIVDRQHEIIPDGYRSLPAGTYLTFVVDDVEVQHQIALQAGDEIIAAPHDTFYGQRRLLLKDPNGLLVDISSLM
ncbi:MAG: VOC family protein [Bacteroidota bacterium]